MSQLNNTYSSIIDSLRRWLFEQDTFGERLIDIIDKEIESIVLQQQKHEDINLQMSQDSYIYLDKESFLINIIEIYVHALKDFLVHLPRCWDKTEKILKEYSKNVNIKFIYSKSNKKEVVFEREQLILNVAYANKEDVFPRNIDEIEEIITEVEAIIKKLKK